MKIYDRGPAATGQADVARTQEAGRSGRSEGQRAASSAQSGSSDSVQISTAAGRVRGALDTAAAGRAERVGALQAAYRSGSYVADSGETSQAMVREALAGGVS
jgi:anti-sigma28 factor (negative regulator of flagellin synthesis)